MEGSAISEFVEYMFVCENPDEAINGLVFRSVHKEESAANSSEIITPLLRLLKNKIYVSLAPYCLVQFWAHKMIGSKHVLTTHHQSFLIGDLNKKLCWYRKECMNRIVNLGGGAKHQLGPVGRAFCNQLPESTPDVKYYSLQDFPQRDLARLSRIRDLLVFPVFEIHRQSCIGVLEVVADWITSNFRNSIEQGLNLAGLSLTKEYFCRQDGVNQRGSWQELKETFEMVAGTYPLALAQAFIPLSSHDNYGFLKQAFYKENMDGLDPFIRAHKDSYLQKLQGIAGEAFAFRKSCFCRNICDFNINKYPYAHYARGAGLTLSFAICIQAIHSKYDQLILEFFLLPGIYSDEYTRSLLSSLLTRLKQHLRSFKIVSEDQGILVEVYAMDDEVGCWRVTRNSRQLSGLQRLQIDRQIEHMNFPNQHVRYSISEFLEYMKPAELFFTSCYAEHFNWVFWNKGQDESQNLKGLEGTPRHICKIRNLLYEIFQNPKLVICDLIQFWAPEKRRERWFLTTSYQPFALKTLKGRYCWYRHQSVNRHIYISGPEEEKPEQLGPVGRAFLNGYPEFSPDVRYYSLQEFQQRDHACLCGLTSLVALPVFETDGKDCVGVLECLDHFDALEIWSLMKCFGHVLSKVGLTLGCYFKVFKHLELPYYELPYEKSRAIEDVFDVVNQKHPLALALAFVPGWCCHKFGHCCLKDSCFLKLAFKRDYGVLHDRDLGDALATFHLLKDKGVAGKALAYRKSYFCRNICHLSPNEYPFVQFARKAGLTLTFAIGLQASENDHLIIEFFLLPDDESPGYLHSLFRSILTTVKHHLRSCRIVAEEEQVEEVLSGLKNSKDGNEIRHSSTLPMMQDDLETEMLASANEHEMLGDFATNYDSHVANVEGPEVSNFHVNNIVPLETPKRKRPAKAGKTADKKEKGVKLQISYDILKQHSGKPLHEVERILKVSKSTIKRRCREYGIPRWPLNESLFEMENTNAPVERDEGLPSVSGTKLSCPDSSLPENLHDSGLVTLNQSVGQDARMVTIKVSYGEKPMIKFPLHFISKLAELEQKVALRLKLKVGSFKLIYQDDDDDMISITCDEDLLFCFQTMTSSSKTTIKMAVKLNLN